jgi:hypothetical protein
MTKGIKQISTGKKILFSCLPLLFLLVFLEIAIRFAYFQSEGPDVLGVITAYRYLQRAAVKKMAELKVRRLNLPAELVKSVNLEVHRALYSPQGRGLLEEFHKIYEEHFHILVQETQQIQSKLVVLYVPTGNFLDEMDIVDANRVFYTDLCSKYGIDWIDMTQTIAHYPPDVVTLLPEDGHLSRFGCHLVAAEIAARLANHFEYRAATHWAARPTLLGDHRPGMRALRSSYPSMPYQVVTNRQGLRMTHEVTFPKTRQRILVLGDSVTFGSFLNNQDTYPELLNRLFPDKEFINAGVEGYTITDEVALFRDRAKYVEPDITVLQVLDNDIYGLFYFYLNKFNREGKTYEASELEKRFLRPWMKEGSK